MRKMKDSGVEWINDIPVAWDIIKSKYSLSIESGNGFPIELQGRKEGDIPFLKVSDINSNDIYVDSSANYVNCEDIGVYGWNTIPANSIIMPKIGEALKKNHRKINTIPCVIDNNTQALVLKANQNPKFNYYLWKHIDANWFDNKGTVPSINNRLLLDEFIPRVTLKEQERIANYLDQKVSLIDNIIEKTKQSIEEYKKLKQSIITEAVTKGLNPDVKMKDSGIEWIGMIPEHWEVIPLKTDFSVTLGKMLSKQQKNKDDTYENYLKAQNIKWNYVDDAIIDKMWFSSYEKDMYLLNEGDILISEGGDSGTTSIYRNEANPCYIQNAVHRVTTRGNSLNVYLYYWMNHVYHIGYIGLICNKATLTHYTKIKVLETPFVRAPQVEQREIVSFLDYRVNEIENLISKKEMLINQYKAYKKSLIYEAVTGKKEIA